jgi:phosphoribosylamine--glycine ligase
MGAISPVPFVDDALLSKIESRIIKPTINGLKKDLLPYKGFIFIGLIIVNNEPKVIEYNVRMGDPETEVVLPRIETDLMEIFIAIRDQKLDKISLSINPKSATTVVLVSGGYPESYEKGKEISGLDSVENALVFHAGAKRNEDKVVTCGGRVMAITAFGNNFKEALKGSYFAASKISFEGINYRKDLGFDL